MLHSLRNRLIASHVLPILLILPLMGIALLVVLENRFLLPVVYGGLEEDAVLLSEVVGTQPLLWQDAVSAQSFLESAGPFLGGDATLILPDGRVLASSSPLNTSQHNQITELPDFRTLEPGQVARLQNGPSAAVFIPVQDPDGVLLGIVRLSTQLTTVTEQIYQMRYLIGAVLLTGVAVGAVFASLLALQIEQPILHASQAITELSEGETHGPIPVEGPEEIRALVRAVNGLSTRLRDLEQARRQLLANVVHELGRPLGALRSATQAMLKGADSDPQLAEDLLQGMDLETVHLQRLLEDLAGMYDQVLGTLELDRKPLDPAKWLPVELLPWKTAAQEKGLIWETTIPEHLPVVQADPDRLSQAIGNLLSNAIKFTPPGGQVAFRVEKSGEKVCIEIADTGPGVPPGEMDAIFSPFFRGGQGKRIVQGMGLGLTIARDIVEAHGGRIAVENQEPVGAVFRIFFPFDERE